MKNSPDISASSKSIHWVLRISACLCFVGHGAFGFITKEGWIQFFSLVGIPRDFGFSMMPLIGTVDVLVGIAVLIAPCRAALAYMVFWALMTAALRPAVGMGFSEFFERAGNYGVPFALLYLYLNRTSDDSKEKIGWFKILKPIEITKSQFSGLLTLLQFTVGSLLVGHGVLALIIRKESIGHHFASAPLFGELFSPLQMMISSGLIEIILGLAIIVRPTVFLAIFAFAWKVGTEFLFPLSGDYFWEFVERSGSYGAPLALALLLRTRKDLRLEDFWPGKFLKWFSKNIDNIGTRAAIYGLLLIPTLAFASGILTLSPTWGTHNRALGIVKAKASLINGEELLTKLRQGGLIVYFRHFSTPGKKFLDDTRNWEHISMSIEDYKDCSWQRPLSKFGRELATHVGRAIKDAEIPVGEIHASPYCRCIDSATLVTGSEPILHRKLVYRKKEFTWERMETFAHEFLQKQKPLVGENTFIFGHKTQMQSLGAIGEGEAYVLEPGDGSGYKLIGKIKPENWFTIDKSLNLFGRSK